MISRILHLILILLTFINGFAQQNVMISNIDFPNEPSICINPNNTNQLIAGSNLNNVYKSNDAGATWTRNVLTSTYGVWGDPTIICDNNNNFYFFHLSNPPTNANMIYYIECQKTSNLGTNWSTGSYIRLNTPKKPHKQWAIFDNTTNNIYVTWTEFDSYGSTNPADKSNIRFSKSSDFGATWSTALKINNVDGNCIDQSDTVEGAVPTVGPNGELYVSWSGPNGLVFKKSLNQGATWSPTETTISAVNRWDYVIPGVGRCNGLPTTSCDRSGSANNGTIYVNWSDQRNGINNTDVFISKSTNGGTSWSTPLKVNNDGVGKHQFLSWMTIDQTTGYIYIVFYDRRNYTDDTTDVYLAHSTNGGATFTNTKISTTSFLPVNGPFFGDYTNITAHNGIIRPIWARMDNGDKSVWTALISQNSLGNEEYSKDDVDENVITNYSNPAREDSYFAFKLYKDSKVSITRKKVVNKSGAKFLSSKKEQTFTFDITVRNKKNKNINLLLKDQYPLSTDKEIEIELLQSDNAKVNTETGILTWQLQLKANETQKIRISYKVKYPKELTYLKLVKKLRKS